MKKSISIAIVALLMSAIGIAQAETLRAVTVEQNASYAIDTDSIVQSNGKTAFSVQTVYTSKMKAPNGSEYTKATNTFLADCKAKTQALTGVSLMEGSGKVLYTYTPTVTEAPMITPEKNSLDAKIMQTACSLR
jgi:type 1 fimbria pilin